MRQEPDHTHGKADSMPLASDLSEKLSAEPLFTVELGLCTHRGTNPTRPLNEDSVLGYLALGRPPDGVCAVAALADGMGGGQLGERASAEAIEYVSRALCGGNYREWATHCSLPASAFDHTTKELAKQIHSQLLAESSNRGVQGSMCATLDILLLTPDRYYIAHAGDSVVWQVRGSTVSKLTEDHSEETYARLHGLPRPKEDGAVTNILGQPAGIRIDPISGALEPDTTFILTSDGVHRKLQRRAMTYCLEGRNAQEAAEELVGVAVRMDGTDNASVVVVRLLPSGTKSSGIPPGQPVLLPSRIEDRRTNDCVVPNGLAGSPGRARSAPGGASPLVGGTVPKITADPPARPAPVEHGPPLGPSPQSSTQSLLVVGVVASVLISIGVLISFIAILLRAERPVTREELDSVRQQISGLAALEMKVDQGREEESNRLTRLRDEFDALREQLRSPHQEPETSSDTQPGGNAESIENVESADPAEAPQDSPPKQSEQEEGG